jgi:NTP pyrophosphatase (non-canonical NTP hydrolase)
MDIEQLTEKIQAVADQYSQKFSVEYSDDWFVMKLQEELGELVQAHLILSGRTRRRADTRARNS